MTTLAGQGDKIPQPQEIILSCPKKKVLIPANVDLISGKFINFPHVVFQDDHHGQVIIKSRSSIEKHDPAIK